MGLEATWSLVDIPADARDAAQAAARREGLPVGEWLTRRILKRFSELNSREQEEAFVALRNHVTQLAARLDRAEEDSRAEPMREALRKLHQALTRLNEEMVRTAGHSTIQISQLSTSLEALSGRMDELHQQDVESRSTFERRMAQLQEFVEGVNLRHSAETRTIASRMDSIGGTLAESRRLIAGEHDAVERLEENLAKADARYNSAFRAFGEKFDSLSDSIQRVHSAASDSSGALDRRIASLQAEFGRANVRAAEEKQLAAAALAKLHGKIDDLQADATGMCGALDRRVLLSQQALQSLDSRHAELAHSLVQSSESIAMQMETVRTESARGVAELEARIADVKTQAQETTATDAAVDNRLAAIEHQLSDLTDRTNAAMSASSALLPKTEAIEAQLEKFTLRLDSEAAGQQSAIQLMKADLLQQTLTALGEKLETEGRKQQSAIADLKNDLLNQLSQAFDERAEAEEQKHHDAMAELQSNFAMALHGLGETLESQARRQQDALAELKAGLNAPQSGFAAAQKTESEISGSETVTAEHAPALAENFAADSHAPDSRTDESLDSAPSHEPDEPVFELTALADPAPAQDAAPAVHAEDAPQPAANEPPSSASPEMADSTFEYPSFGSVEQLAPAAMMARDSANDVPAAPSYLSAARQSLQAAAVRSDGESPAKELFGFRFLKSLSLAGKQKGQTTSYALIAGIALVAILALIVGAMELVNRREPPPHVRLSAKPIANHAALTRAAKYVVPKRIVSPASGAPAQDRTAALAKGGDAQSQLLLGLRGLAKGDTADAAAWLERAALQGQPVAQYRLATLYASGRGVPAADKIKAFRWYLAAAQAGNRKAMSNLAVAYAQGDGTAKNPQEAGRWFLKAAQLGLADAQFDLAILYERGLGVPQNLTDAYRWYVIAAKSGDKESKDRVEALGSQLTTEDRAAAEAAAAEFKATPMNARANEPQ